MMFMHFDANLFFLSMFLNINCKYNHWTFFFQLMRECNSWC
jgi:hypothetical protein